MSYELRESLLKEFGIRLLIVPPGEHNQGAPLQLLEPVLKHWAVLFLKDGRAHLDHVVRTNPNEISIKRRMMHLAE